MFTVYPRVCGGTIHVSSTATITTGLSPRLRGNLFKENHERRYLWSIPASAGEPHRNVGLGPFAEVYPRVCGGTCHHPQEPCAGQGLSPRLRGNHGPGHGPHHLQRSIPASAGEPCRWPGYRERCEVYPRVCGGTLQTFPRVAYVHGLSPRLRGNHPRQQHRHYHDGSIPASAGEPLQGEP